MENIGKSIELCADLPIKLMFLHRYPPNITFIIYIHFLYDIKYMFLF